MKRSRGADGGRGEGRGGARGAPYVEFVYQDEDIVAVDKPAGLPTISPEGGGRSLYDIVTKVLRGKNPKARAAVVHRLDRDTSGIVVFATNARMKRALMENWDSWVLERGYVALVEGAMGAGSGILDSYLAETEVGRVRETAAGTRGAKRAITRWRLIGEGAGLSLLALELETGRKHQIRAQLSAAAHPVVGDARYGARRDDLGRLCLHASAIELALPDAVLRFESPPPPGFREALRGSPRVLAAFRGPGAPRRPRT